jgi:3-methylcrotonyl-CoA carboxylase alpha subunit
MATVTRIGAGVYRVDDDGGQTIVYVAGTAGDQWAFWNGEVYREQVRDQSGPPKGGHSQGGRHYDLAAPMPATVVKILVTAGQTVKQGETLVVLEAMKMELPIRAPADAVVQAINCREGELVQPERPLVELA